MSDDLDRLLIRRDALTAPVPGRSSSGAPAFVGKVVSTGTNLAVGKFLLVNPVVVTGAETEGGAGTFAVDTTRTVPVYVVGPGVPATGDYLICRRVDHRWVASRRVAGPPPGTIDMTPSGCSCGAIPSTLALVYTPNPSYPESYPSRTLEYVGPLFTSSQLWRSTAPIGTVTDFTGNTAEYHEPGSTEPSYYYFLCNGSIFQVTSGTLTGIGGTFQRSSLGDTGFGINTCSPFNIRRMDTPTGTVFVGHLSVSG